MQKKLKLAKKIKELRENMGLSQEKFANKLGLSRVAISQFENGKRGLDALELIKIAEIFDSSVDYLLKDGEQKNVKKEVSIKPFKFNQKKLKNAILYILEKCGGKANLGETVLYKLLYFIDFDNYELYGRPITGIRYVKLQYGPVPRASEYNAVVEEMEKNKELERIERDYHGMKQRRYIAFAEPDLSFFNGAEIKIIDDVIDRLSDMNAKMIENYAHDDAPWRMSENKQIISYDLVFERIAPYAHRDYETEFMQTSAQDIHNNLEPLTKEEHDYYMNL